MAPRRESASETPQRARVPQRAQAAARRLGEQATALVGRRPQLAGAVGAATAAAAGTAGLLLRRRRRTRHPALPDPGSLASTTAVSVHTAAKGAVVSAVRQATPADGELLAEVVTESVHEAAGAGADVTAAAIGSVEGALEIAHLLDGLDGDTAAASRAAHAAAEAADACGAPASSRVREALGPYLSLG